MATKTPAYALLRAFRTRNELTTDELARGLGVHERTVRKWEDGERSVPQPLIVLLEILAINSHVRGTFLARCREPNEN